MVATSEAHDSASTGIAKPQVRADLDGEDPWLDWDRVAVDVALAKLEAVGFAMFHDLGTPSRSSTMPTDTPTIEIWATSLMYFAPRRLDHTIH